MEIVSTAPAGFETAIAVLNKFPIHVVDALALNILEFVVGKSGSINTQYAKKNVPDASDIDVNNAVNGLIYLFRSFIKQKTPLENVGEVLVGLFEKDIAISIGKMWKANGAAVVSSGLSSILSIGTLVDMKWKCGVALQSSKCNSLNSAFVSLVFVVADASGNISNHPMELSVPEFQEVLKHFTNMNNILQQY
eukprot:c33280_g1_i1.p1 GENE.c33280_g1_i1~~c33280_g1_i1.p1  ORF type:complete len:193 (+),score=4.63 c33280_g1_i1:50-628(+)